MIRMILRDLLKHFNIEESFPEHLLEQSFNKVFLDGELSKSDNNYKIVVTTRQDVTHQLFLGLSCYRPVRTSEWFVKWDEIRSY